MLAHAFDEYRQQHNLLFPKEMRRIRARWGLGQRPFSLLLGWGEITLHRYEAGSLQDSAHDVQIRMAEYPENMRILLEANGDRLTPRQRASVEKRLSEITALEADSECGDEALEHLLARESTGQYGGETLLSMVKLREMIVYFCQVNDMFVTKLAKLMFYADFLHHKENTTSITGLAYAHLPHGPVPEHYERIRADLSENGIARTEERCGSDWAGEVLVAERQPNLDVFAADEIRVLEYVRSNLAGLTSIAVRDKSHAETAYTTTQMGQRIPYAKAADLSLSLE
ncbi:MAG: type II toxin-antitoxin system antitoxin SocA domain-containing protein [Coriobacteriia bacterium]